MKKSFITLSVMTLTLLLTACAKQSHQPTMPLDQRTVEEYNRKVQSGNTVPREHRVKNPKPAETPVNQSDKRSGQNKRFGNNTSSRPVVLTPHIGFGYGYHRHHW